LQSGKRLGAAVLPWRIGFPSLKIALILAMIYFAGSITLRGVVAVAIVAVLIVVAWQWRAVVRWKLVGRHRSPEPVDGAALLAISVPMMAVMLVVIALTQLDLFMIEALGSEHEVGHFAAAATTAHMVVLAQVAVVGLFAPLIGPALTAGGRMKRSLFWRGQRLILLISIPLAGGLLIFGGDLLSLFGADFDHATPALRMLTLGYLASALAAFAATWLQYVGRGRAVVVISGCALLIDAACNVLWIPRYGMAGAAMATAVAMCAAAAATWWVLVRSRCLAEGTVTSSGGASADRSRDESS
jgi:O-antigen/teichoic acid export membrane protein